MLWVRGFRAPTISRRGFNVFKPLRRHLPATPSCRQPLAPRSRRPKRSFAMLLDLRPPGRKSRLPNSCSSEFKKAAPSRPGSGGGLKSPENTIAQISFSRKNNRRRGRPCTVPAAQCEVRPGCGGRFRGVHRACHCARRRPRAGCRAVSLRSGTRVSRPTYPTRCCQDG